MNRWESVILICGFVLSLAVHAILLPAFYSTIGDESAPQLKSELQAETPQRKVELGIKESTPVKLTWIGSNKPEEHLAEPAKIDQAAFTDQPSPPTAVTPQLPNQPDETAEQTVEQPQTPPAVENEQPLPDETKEEVEPLPPSGSAPLVPEPMAAEPELPQPNTQQETDPGAGSDAASPARIVELLRRLEALQRLALASKSADSFSEDHLREKEKVNVTNEQSSADQTEAQPDQPAATPSPPSEGDPSDRQSDPTSIIDVPPDKWKTGKPVAAEGLEIKTRKPKFTLLTLMTSAPRNPLYEIRFNRAGKPQLVRQLKPSGYNDVDRAVEASLYAWRAEGEQLQSLTKNQTLDVRIQIILIGD